MANGAEQPLPLPPSQCQHKQGLCSAELPAFLKPEEFNFDRRVAIFTNIGRRNGNQWRHFGA